MLAEPGKRRESRVWCVQFARVETAFVDQREPIDGFCALRAPKCIQLENAQKRSENCVDFFRAPSLSAHGLATAGWTVMFSLITRGGLYLLIRPLLCLWYNGHDYLYLRR